MQKIRKIEFRKAVVPFSSHTIIGVEKKTYTWVEDNIVKEIIKSECKHLNISVKKISISGIFSNSVLIVKCDDEQLEELINWMKITEGITFQEKK